MTTTVKTFKFKTSTEGWSILGTEDGSTTGGRYARRYLHQSTGKGLNPVISNFLGGLHITERSNNNGPGSGYAQYSGTWQSLGVPMGETVTNVQLDYWFRVQAPTQKSAGVRNSGIFYSSLNSGPAELYNSSDSLQGTFSAADTSTPSRGGASDYGAYPAGPAGTGTPGELNAFIGTPGPGYRKVTGANLSVPSPMQPSGSTAHLRISAEFPDTNAVPSWWVRWRVGQVTVTITSSSGTTTTKTETGVSRIKATATKTETGKARITTTATKTETAVSRIKVTTQKTENGVARIQKTSTQTETGIARIGLITSKTETGISRITGKTQKTETGVARISVSGTVTTKTMTGIASINPPYTTVSEGSVVLQLRQNKTILKTKSKNKTIL